MEVKPRKKVYLSGKIGSSERAKFAKLAQDIRNDFEDLKDSAELNSKLFFTSKEVCKYLDISKFALDRYASDGIIPFTKPANKLRYFLKEDVDRFATNKENRVKSKEEIESEASSWTLKNKR